MEVRFAPGAIKDALDEALEWLKDKLCDDCGTREVLVAQSLSASVDD